MTITSTGIYGTSSTIITSDLYEDVEQLKPNVTTLTASHLSVATNHDGRLDILEVDNTSNKINITCNTTRIGDLETDVTSNTVRIVELETDNTSNKDRLGDLETDNTSNKDRLGDLETDNTSNKDRLGDLETDVSSNTSRIVELETDVTSNTTRIGDLETDVSSNTSRIVELETDVTSNTERIVDLEDHDSNHALRLTDLETQVFEVEHVANKHEDELLYFTPLPVPYAVLEAYSQIIHSKSLTLKDRFDLSNNDIRAITEVIQEILQDHEMKIVALEFFNSLSEAKSTAKFLWLVLR